MQLGWLRRAVLRVACALLVLQASAVSSVLADESQASVSPVRALRTSVTDIQDNVRQNARSAASRSRPIQGKQPLSHGDQSPPRRLDIVIAHHDMSNLQEVVQLWLQVLKLPNVEPLKPYVYIYCQNPTANQTVLQDALAPILQRGEIEILNNVGREGRVFLHHIVSHYDRLAQHTLFSQDVRSHVDDDNKTRDPAPERLRALFRPAETGVLALSLTLNETCDDRVWADNPWQATPLMYQTYALATGQYCPPEGFVAFYKGQFVASSRRIRARQRAIYAEMLHLLEAPRDHWVHRLHRHPGMLSPVNPYFGHVVERAWSLLLGCHDPGRGFVEACRACDRAGWRGCLPEACQCLDAPETVRPRASLVARLSTVGGR